MCFYLIEIGIQIYLQFLLGKWSRNKGVNSSYNYISIYCLISLLFLLCDLGFHILYIYFFKNLSYNSHLRLVKKLLHAPLCLFDNTQIGHILFRLSDDQNAIDRDLLWQFKIFINAVLNCIFSFIVMIYVFPLFFVIISFSLYLYISLYFYYYFSFKDIRKIENKFKSSIITLLTETWEGLITIRATKLTNFIGKKMEERLKKLVECNFMMYHCSLWVSQRIDLLNAIILGLLSVFIIYYKNSDDSLSVSLVLTQGLKVYGQIGYLFFVLSNLDIKMDSIVRIIQFTNEIKCEERLKKPRSIANWPSEGKISISNLSLKYRDDAPLVLNNVSLEIKSFEKIGIVGRTGSGKSSLFLCLMRIIEPFHCDLKSSITLQEKSSPIVLIDDINYELIDRHELRSKISIVLQDPFLFKGTIRNNIDPFNFYSNQEVFECLIKTNIASRIHAKIQSNHNINKQYNKFANTIASSSDLNFQKANTEKNRNKSSDMEVRDEYNYFETIDFDDSMKREILNYEVKEKGSNFSSGEKQLICIARALIKKAKILIMDEATSNIDMNTDHFIQEMIMKEFKFSTVLTIAHRLQTIIGYDRIIFLKNGSILEIGKPLELLSNEKSEVYGLFAENGKDILEKTIKMFYEK